MSSGDDAVLAALGPQSQVVFAECGRLLAETSTHLVLGTQVGDDRACLQGGRLEILDDVVARRGRLVTGSWHTSRVLWLIPPDGSWRWKDEDEMAYAVKIGMFGADQAAAIRAEGERVIAQLPSLLPTGWEDWQPDPEWPPVPLPDGWDQV